ncbi:MAG: alpha/beta hydrolase [Marinobacter sp.]|uniref:alpha/beta fold hydrolase n=1 Tax=Marinobacter sp. TaxID=50741 RepID=UPI00299D4FE2|nr:alpha/beta hydrolase [Marinobacter sp.]MDX1633559.1 alpha/beta hydrolase [Marinobacter sp.]
MHWILLRGLTREQAHWGDLPERLAASLPEHRFHTLDLPGTGNRYRDTSPWTIAGIRQRVAQAAAHIPPPYGLIALSMGGMVALDWAQAEPRGRIQYLVLINTSGGFSPPWQRFRPSALPAVVRLLSRRELFDREAGILALTSNRPVATETVKRWYSIQRQRPVSRQNALRQLTAAARYRPRAQRPLPDALVLASRGDRIVDWRCSRALEQRWQWRLQVHPHAGHDLPLDAPDWVVAQIVAYLRGQA